MVEMSDSDCCNLWLPEQVLAGPHGKKICSSLRWFRLYKSNVPRRVALKFFYPKILLDYRKATSLEQLDLTTLTSNQADLSYFQPRRLKSYLQKVRLTTMAATNSPSSTYSTARSFQVDWAQSQQTQTFYDTLQSEYDITILPVHGSLPHESSMKLRLPRRLRTHNNEPTQNTLSSPAGYDQKTLSLVQRAQDKQTQDFHSAMREESFKKLQVPARQRSNNTEITQNSSSSSATPSPRSSSLVQWAQDKQTLDFHQYMRTQKCSKKLRVPARLRSNNTESTPDPSSSPATPFQNTPSLVQWAHDKQTRDFHRYIRIHKCSKTLRVPSRLRSNNTESTSAKPFQNTPSLVQWAHDKQTRDFHHAMRAQMSLLKLFA